MNAEIVCTIIATLIVVGTVVHQNGKSSGKIETWMKGHEQLDATRFEDIKKDIARLDAKL